MSPTRLGCSGARYSKALTRKVEWPRLNGFQLSESLEFGAVKTLPVPTKLAQQPGSGQPRIVMKSPVGVTVAGVAILPATTDALEQDDIAVSLDRWHATFTPGHAAPVVKVDLLQPLRHDRSSARLSC